LAPIVAEINIRFGEWTSDPSLRIYAKGRKSLSFQWASESPARAGGDSGKSGREKGTLPGLRSLDTEAEWTGLTARTTDERLAAWGA